MAKRQSQLDKVIAVLEAEIEDDRVVLDAKMHALNKLKAEQTKAAARKPKAEKDAVVPRPVAMAASDR